MNRFNALATGEKLLLGAGALLALDLLLLPWHDIIFVNRTALQSPNALWGWLAFLVALATVVWLVLTRFTTTKLPALPVPLARAETIAGIAAGALVLVKLIVETSFLGAGAYIGVALGAAMAAGGVMVSRTPGTPGTPGPAGPPEAPIG